MAGEPAAGPGKQFPPGAVLAIALAAVALAVFAAAELRPSGPAAGVVARSVAYGIACCAALALVGGRYRAGWGLGQFRTGPVYLLWSAVTLGLATIAWQNPQPGRVSIISRTGVQAAMAVATVGLAAWMAGYLTGPGRRVGRWVGRLAAVAAPAPIGAGAEARADAGAGVGAGFGVGARALLRWPAMPWLLCAGASAARLAQLKYGSYGYLGDASAQVSRSTWFAQPLRVIAEFGVAAVVVAAVDLSARPASLRRWAGFAVLVAVELGFAVVSGMREQFIMVVAAVVVTFAVTRPRWAAVSAALAVAVFLLVVVPFNAAYREIVRTQHTTLGPPDAVRAAPSTFVAAVVRPGAGLQTASASAGTLASRLRHVDSLAVVVQRTPRQVAYRPVSEVLFAPLLSVVPRAVWADKPLRVEGYLFGQQYYDMPTNMYSADAILPQADLFRHGGLAVVIVGMAVLGAACRVLDDQFHPAADPRLVVAYLPLLFTLVKSEAGAVQLAATVPVQAMVLVCLSRFAFGRPATVVPAGQPYLPLPSQQEPTLQDQKVLAIRRRRFSAPGDHCDGHQVQADPEI